TIPCNQIVEKVIARIWPTIMFTAKRDGWGEQPSRTMRASKDKPLPLSRGQKPDKTKVPQKQRRKTLGELIPLVEFLNGNLDRSLYRAFSAPAADMSSAEEEGLRAELIEDLSPIADLPKNGIARFKRSGKVAAAGRIEAQLKYLCEKINSLVGIRP